MARPRKLNKRIADLICEAIEVGAGYDDAAANAGITRDTLAKWRKDGEALLNRVNAEANTVELSPDEIQLWRFYTQFLEAEGRGIVNLATVAFNGAMKDPRLALEVLARRRPDLWSPTQNTRLSGADGGPVASEVVHIYMPDNGRESHGD